MPLKLFILKLSDPQAPLTSKRKVEHLLIKYSGIKISLAESINIITAVDVGKEVEVLFNTARLEAIEPAFLKYSVLVVPKIK